MRADIVAGVVFQDYELTDQAANTVNSLNCRGEIR
jgi:hypothetical protein